VGNYDFSGFDIGFLQPLIHRFVSRLRYFERVCRLFHHRENRELTRNPLIKRSRLEEKDKL
jgi:hypothetical protein